MRIELGGPGRFLCACGAIAVLHLAATAAGDGLAGTRAAPLAATLGAAEAGAQITWGVASRTARRTTRRTVRRDEYLYTTAAAPAVGSAAANAAYDQCYPSGGRRYCAQMVGGEVVYVAAS